MTPADAETRFTQLYKEHYDEVLAYCTRRIGRSEADDATAEVFAAAWRRFDEARWESARAWLFGIARGVLANQWRSLRRRTRLLGRVWGLRRDTPEIPEALVVRRAEDEQVIAAVHRLRPLDQEVLMLAAWEELTGPEMAQALKVSVSAAEQRLHRAKRRLATELGNLRSAPNLSPRAADNRGGHR